MTGGVLNMCTVSIIDVGTLQLQNVLSELKGRGNNNKKLFCTTAIKYLLLLRDDHDGA